MDLIEQLRRAAVSTELVLERVESDGRDRPTPCPEMTVAQAASHLIGGLRAFAVVGEGGVLAFDASLDPDPHSERLAPDFRVAADRVLAAFSEPDRLEASYDMPWGPTTGFQLVGFELIEVVVHGWDIARGLGTELVIDDDLAAATLDGARRWVDDSVRVPGMFGPEVPTTSGSALDRLVAFLGRDPGWTGAAEDAARRGVGP